MFQQVRTVQEADEDTWSHPKFQQILWDDPSVSSIGPGQSVTLVSAYDDRSLAAGLFQARGSIEGLPLDQRGAALDDLYRVGTGFGLLGHLLRVSFNRHGPKPRPEIRTVAENVNDDDAESVATGT